MARLKHIAISTISLLTSSVSQVSAQVDIGNEFYLRQGVGVNTVFPNLGSLVSTVLPNLFVIAGLILLFILIGGGFTIVSSGGNPEKTGKGKQAITGAIIGFAIILISYWIVQLVEMATGVNIFNNTNL